MKRDFLKISNEFINKLNLMIYKMIIQLDNDNQLEFYPGKQEWSSIQKSMHIINHITRIKEKKNLR